VIHILIAATVIGATLHFTETRERWKLSPQRMEFELCHQHLGQFTDAHFIIGISDIDYAAVSDGVPVLDDAVQTLHAIRDVREAAPLVTAVNELDWGPLREIQN
jgi:hypothetical protein